MNDKKRPVSPVQVRLSGEQDREPIVMMTQATIDYIRDFAKQDTSKERGGVLVGTMEEITGRTYRILILGAIEGKHTDASSVSLKFTHETWNHVHEVKDAKYPDLKIVGWFHSHPGLGIFLSRHDLFIQRNFFQEPWQVAYVVDPVRDSAGLFYWDKDAIVEAGTRKQQGPTVLNMEETEPAEKPAAVPPAARSRWILPTALLLVFLAGSVVGAAVVLLAHCRNSSRPADQAKTSPATARSPAAIWDRLQEWVQAHFGAKLKDTGAATQ